MAKADYALCEICEGKGLYHPDDIPTGVVVFHQECLGAYRAGVRELVAKAIDEESDKPMSLAQRSGLQWAARIVRDGGTS